MSKLFFTFLLFLSPILSFADPAAFQKHIQDITTLFHGGYAPSAVYYLTSIIQSSNITDNLEMIQYRYHRAIYSLYINLVSYFDEDIAEIKRLCEIDSKCQEFYHTLQPSLESYMESPLYILGKKAIQ